MLSGDGVIWLCGHVTRQFQHLAPEGRQTPLRRSILEDAKEEVPRHVLQFTFQWRPG